MLLCVRIAKIGISHHRSRFGALNYGRRCVATLSRRRWAEERDARVFTELLPRCPLSFDAHTRRAGGMLQWRWRQGEKKRALTAPDRNQDGIWIELVSCRNRFLKRRSWVRKTVRLQQYVLAGDTSRWWVAGAESSRRQTRNRSVYFKWSWIFIVERSLERLQGLSLSRVLSWHVWLGKAMPNVPLTEAALFYALNGDTTWGVLQIRYGVEHKSTVGHAHGYVCVA